MEWFEKICISIRHSKLLGSVEWIWNFIRPRYNFLVGYFGAKGLKRLINGRDMILVAPECRGVNAVYEPDVWQHMMQRIHIGDKIADIGANMGLYAIALGKRVGCEGKICAFEPDPNNFKVLKKNVALNQLDKVVDVIPKAVSDQCGEVVFQEGVGPESRLSFNNEIQSRGAAIRVECTTIDGFFSEGSLTVLKIDVEGFEQQVLLGGKKLLSDPKRAPRHIYLEVHPFAWGETNTTGQSLLSLLRGYGYEVYFLDGQRVEEITKYGEVYCIRQ